jgi:hypothetical protein
MHGTPIFKMAARLILLSNSTQQRMPRNLVRKVNKVNKTSNLIRLLSEAVFSWVLIPPVDDDAADFFDYSKLLWFSEQDWMAAKKIPREGALVF